jgi:hypothetical protein
VVTLKAVIRPAGVHRSVLEEMQVVMEVGRGNGLAWAG